ncbi:MAG: arylsulfatase [Acidimicrobiia bacterium]|nr:arylsulfatase [Acidimicrobiia bacterium]
MSPTRARLTPDLSESTPPAVPFRPGAPNVVVVVLDDLGFAQLGCYGSDIETPVVDRIAGRGLRFNNFHTTAICSPTRACLLTGRNHHRVGMGMLPDIPMRFPGYTGRIPPEAGTLARVLGDAGWATFAVGKWHLTPRDERTPAGPYTTWPLGSGFGRFYGVLGGDANHWTPNLVRDNTFVDPPASPEEGYHLTEDLADSAIGYIRELRTHQPDRPFFLWFATGATHSPHHVPADWIERYRGRFDAGWDEWRESTLARQAALGVVPAGTRLSDRPPWVQAWADLPERERDLYARMQEVFAAFLTHTDHQLGRLIDHIEASGELDNTIVVVTSDNGTSGEGGPHGSVNELRFIAQLPEDLEQNMAMIDELGGWHTYNHYPWGWALAGNTPAQRWKRYTLEGGIRDPLILSWPAGGIADGSVRGQYCHAVDVMPTILDLVDIRMPERVDGVEQMSLDGVSLRDVVEQPDADEVRTTQYFECWGSRAVYRDGWKAATDHVNQQVAADRELMQGSSDFDLDTWRLFHVAEDFAEVEDLSATHPERLAELVDLWYSEAERNSVLPIDDGLVRRFAHLDQRWLSYRPRVVLQRGDALHEEAAPALSGGFRMAAAFGRPLETGDEGVICEQGDWTNGWAWILQGGRTTWMLNHVGERTYSVGAAVPPGAESLTVSGVRADDGTIRCTVDADGTPIGAGEIPVEIPFRWTPNGAFLTVGYGRPFPVSDTYEPPFEITADLVSVVIDSGEIALPETLTEIEIALHHE